jgi:hypothetical protein
MKVFGSRVNPLLRSHTGRIYGYRQQAQTGATQENIHLKPMITVEKSWQADSTGVAVASCRISQKKGLMVKTQIEER